MMRWLLVCVLLCGGIVAAIYFTSPARTSSPAVVVDPGVPGDKHQGAGTGGDRDPLGLPPVPFNAGVAVQRGLTLDVWDARVTVPERTKVPAEHDGKILFIGTEFKPGERVPTGTELERKILEGKIYAQEMRFLAVELAPSDPVPPASEQVVLLGPDGKADGKRYRRWKEGDRLEGGKLKVCKEMRYFRKLELEDRVRNGDLLAQLNPALALDDLMVKAAKLEAAESEMMASLKTRDEAERRFLRDRALRSSRTGSISEDDLRASELAWQRYAEEVKAKTAAISSAQQELNQTITVLKMHEIRCVTNGSVKQFTKFTGEAIKNLDQLLELNNVDRPRIEGSIGLQHARGLRLKNDDLMSHGQAIRVTVEVSRPIPPRKELVGHSRAVTAVAVSAGETPFILSGDEEGELRGWNPETGSQLWQPARHGVAVRSLACSPAGAPDGNRALVGLGDGTAYLLSLDLKQLAKAQGAKGGASSEVRWVLGGKDDKGRSNKAHAGPVNCVAFSPDGTLCATGGDDRDIVVWDAATQQVLHRIREAHRGPVTSLQFAANDELVSAGRDNTMLLWKLDGKEPPVQSVVADYRSNSVPQLGVYRGDGSGGRERLALLDLGKELRIFSLDTHQTVANGVLHNPSGSGAFATMALFSPDGRTILTNNPGDGKLQLWRAPSADKRAYEQRQLGGADLGRVSSATCGAFGQKAKDNFAVTGAQDGRVLIWDLPAAEEEPLEAALTYVQGALDNNAQRVSIWAVPTRTPVPAWVVPGSTATMVIHPDETVRIDPATP